MSRHPVLICDVPPGTALAADVTDWLADNGVPGYHRPVIYTGTQLVEWLDPDLPQQRHWAVRTPIPRGLLAQLAAAAALYCTAVHPGHGAHPLRCARRVDSAGRHHGLHRPADQILEVLDQDAWDNFVLPTRAAQERARGTRNRAISVIGEERLASLLRLPPGQRIIGFEPRLLTLDIAVHLEGDGLPETLAGCEPLQVGPHPFDRLTAVVDADDQGVIHEQILEAVDDPSRLESTPSAAGRRRILERHEPTAHPDGGPAWCERCHGRPLWPCDDYRDATADVAHVTAWHTNLAGEQP